MRKSKSQPCRHYRNSTTANPGFHTLWHPKIEQIHFETLSQRDRSATRQHARKLLSTYFFVSFTTTPSLQHCTCTLSRRKPQSRPINPLIDKIESRRLSIVQASAPTSSLHLQMHSIRTHPREKSIGLNRNYVATTRAKSKH